MTVYIAGKITGDPEYRAKFAHAQEMLKKQGYIVINPAVLPSVGFDWGACMRIASAMLDECDAVYFLPDWMESKGARIEYQRAKRLRKRILEAQHE